jgi:serine/threonine-protein kinase
VKLQLDIVEEVLGGNQGTEGATVIAESDAVVGKYRVVRTLARSRSAVYEGIDPVMGRRVAIKELLIPVGATLPEAERLTRCFEDDARAAGSLTHPNIVTVLGVQKENDRHFVLMEYLEGGTVREALSKYISLAPAKALWIALQASEALAYAHAHGAVHGALTPEHVHVLPTGQVKLTGFGDRTHGDLAGCSITYQSPERIMGNDPDARTDVFLLGELLCEMLTGRPPFAADTTDAITQLILNAPPPIPGTLSPTLRAILLCALARDPAQRYASMNQMAADLRRERLAMEATAPTIAFRPSPAPRPGQATGPSGAVAPSQQPVASAPPPAAQRPITGQPVASRSLPVAPPGQRPAVGVAPGRPKRRAWLAATMIAGIVFGTVGAGLAFLHFSSALHSRMAHSSVYKGALTPGWSVPSTSTEVNLNSTNPVRSDTSAIAVKITRPYGRLVFENPSYNGTGFKRLTFWIYGGTRGCANLWVRGLLPGGNLTQAMSPLPPLQPDKWAYEKVDLPSVGMDRSTGCAGFCIQDQSGTSGQTFSVDDVRLQRS